MRILKIIFVSGLLLGPAFPLASAPVSSPLFDKPLQEKHVPLPKDPDNPQSKPMLSCFYYPHFMVKQVDLGELGAEQLSILPVSKGQAAPPCRRANAKDEMVIDAREWSGYFKGVKNDFVFFDADDGVNDGSGFAVFSGADGGKIFEDIAKSDLRSVALIAPGPQSGPNSDSASAILLRYRRVYEAPCSLRADQKNCWNSIEQVTGLADIAPPNCDAAYQAEEKKSPANARETALDPSVITYEVEVVLDSRDTAMRVTPTSKAVECYPAD